MDSRSWTASIVLAAALSACGGPAAPVPPSPPPANDPIPVSGHERIEWDQNLADGVELSRYRFAAYVDSARRQLPDVTCRAVSARAAVCSSRLPAMSPGVHVLTFIAYVDPDEIDSAPSAPLTLVVSAPADARTEQSADERASAVNAVDCAVADLGGGTAIAALPTGELRVVDTQQSRSRTLAWEMPDGDWQLRAVATHPDFSRNRLIYVLLSERSQAFRLALARYREIEGVLGERAVLATMSPGWEVQRPRLRFGPDGKLYAALLGDPTALAAGPAAPRPDDGEGFLIRLNEDGSRPSGPPAPKGSPGLVAGSPAAIDWDAATGELWVAEQPEGGHVRVHAARPSDAILEWLPPPQASAVGLGIFRPPSSPAAAHVWVFMSDGIARRIEPSGGSSALARAFVEGEADRIHDALLTSERDVLSCGSRSSGHGRYFVRIASWR